MNWKPPTEPEIHLYASGSRIYRNPYIEIIVPDTEDGRKKADEFREKMLAAPRELIPFYQGGHDDPTWKKFEFWSRDRESIFFFCSEVAAALGIEITMKGDGENVV